MFISIRWLLMVQRVLLCVFLGAIVYIIYFLGSNQHKHMLNNSILESPQASTSSGVKLPAFPSYESYAATVSKRDLFGTSVNVSDFNMLTSENIPSGTLPTNLKVVGIILGKNAEVIIEDTTRRKTFFVHHGEQKDGMSIDQVKADRIILNYQGQPVTVLLKGSL